jgi:glycosyltransferase involved in cell wall biosynthesis
MNELIRPVRVGILSCNMYPLLIGADKGFGGAELDLWMLGKHLARDLAFNVSILTQTTDANPISASEGMEIQTVRPRPEPRPGKLRGKLSDLEYLRRVFFALIRLNPDIYLTEVASIQALLALMAARIRRKPFVFRFGSDMETSIDSMAGFCFHGSRRLAAKFARAVPRSAAVIAQTDGQAALLKANLGIDSIVIRNAHEMPAEIPPFESRCGVLWLGRADPIKQPDILPALARALPDLSFTFVAAPSKGYESLLTQIQEESAGLTNIRFMPGVSQGETADLFRSHRVMVMTSKAEGLPNVLIESLKHGCPVVTLTTNPDQLLAEVSSLENVRPAPGYCAKGDFEVLTGLVRTLNRDEELWCRCSGPAVATARENFAAQSIMRQYEDLFHSLTR